MNPEVTPDPQNGSSAKPPRKAPWWLLLIPVAALSLVALNRSQPTDVSTEPTPRETASATSEPTGEATRAVKALEVTIFVPNDNAELQKRKVVVPDLDASNLPTAPSNYLVAVGTRAVETLFEQAPETFPSGTRLKKPIQLKDDVATVDLNAAFQQPSFWQKGDAYALLATNAIANTVASAYPGAESVKTRILVEGKPLQTLGELDFSEPMEADPKLVAKP